MATEIPASPQAGSVRARPPGDRTHPPDPSQPAARSRVAEISEVAGPSGGRGRFRALVDIGVIIAVLGLMFTVATYWVDQRSQEREDGRQARAELTAVTGQLTSLYRVYASEIGAASGPALIDITSSMATESVVLLGQAEQLMAENPSIVRSSDDYAVAETHLRVGNYDRAYEAFGRARELAGDDYNLALASVRGLASSLFGLERPEEAREVFESVLMGEAFEGLSESARLANAQFTLVHWARTEAGWGYCPQSSQLLDRLTDSIVAAGRSPNLTAIDELRTSIETACGS